jgi:hypothetical protein
VGPGGEVDQRVALGLERLDVGDRHGGRVHVAAFQRRLHVGAVDVHDLGGFDVRVGERAEQVAVDVRAGLHGDLPAGQVGDRGGAAGFLRQDAGVQADLRLGDQPGGLLGAASHQGRGVAVDGQVELAGGERLVEVGPVREGDHLDVGEAQRRRQLSLLVEVADRPAERAGVADRADPQDRRGRRFGFVAGATGRGQQGDGGQGGKKAFHDSPRLGG